MESSRVLAAICPRGLQAADGPRRAAGSCTCTPVLHHLIFLHAILPRAQGEKDIRAIGVTKEADVRRAMSLVQRLQQARAAHASPFVESSLREVVWGECEAGDAGRGCGR